MRGMVHGQHPGKQTSKMTWNDEEDNNHQWRTMQRIINNKDEQHNPSKKSLCMYSTSNYTVYSQMNPSLFGLVNSREYILFL